MVVLENVIKSEEKERKLIQNQVSSSWKPYKNERLKDKKCQYTTKNDILDIGVCNQGHDDTETICLPITAINNTGMARLDGAERLRLEAMLSIKQRKRHKNKQHARKRRHK